MLTFLCILQDPVNPEKGLLHRPVSFSIKKAEYAFEIQENFKKSHQDKVQSHTLLMRSTEAYIRVEL